MYIYTLSCSCQLLAGRSLTRVLPRLVNRGHMPPDDSILSEAKAAMGGLDDGAAVDDGGDRDIGLFLRDESWTIPLVAVASVNVVSISLFEAFVLAKTLVDGSAGHASTAAAATPTTTWSTTSCMSRRHFFLGQALLLGLFGSSLVGLVFIAPTTPFVCGVTRQLGVALVAAGIVAPLLVKCVFLVSLHDGVYLPSVYLALLLAFALAVQLALGVQWLFLRPPDVVLLRRSWTSHTIVGTTEPNADVVTFSVYEPSRRRRTCNTTFGELLSSLSYVFVMLVGVLVLALRSRRIRDNYRESSYIAVCSVCLLVVWTIAILVTLINGVDYEDPCLAFALEASTAVVFLVMYAPGGRRLAAMGREGLYARDRPRGGGGGNGDGGMDDHRHSEIGSHDLPPPPLRVTPTPSVVYNTMRYNPTGFYRVPTANVYRIPVPDYMCHEGKLSAATMGPPYCRRHVYGPGPPYKSKYGYGYGHSVRVANSNSMLY